MPETPKRYDLKQSWSGADMVRHETGDYVLWDDYEAISSALKESQERHTRLRIAARAVVMAPRLAHRELGNAIDELSEVIENDQPDPTPSPSQEGA